MATTAVVLAGGGVAGIAWELGVLAGLADAGTDLVAGADLVVGTSAGATVAAQVTSGRSLEELFALQQQPGTTEIAVDYDMGERLAQLTALEAGAATEQERLRRIGAMALDVETISEARRLEVVASRLPSLEWPARPVKLTAIDARTGEFVVFDRHSGVSLLDAVAASCAVPGVWPPVTIDGRQYIDGGMRSIANADVAGGYDRVITLCPLALPHRQARLDRERAELEAGGAEVVLVVADDASMAAIGPNPLDPSTRAGVAAAGRAQGARTTIG